MSQLCQVKDRVVNSPCISSPLSHAMNHVLAEHSMLVAYCNDIQLPIGHRFYMHTIRAEIVITIDLVNHAIVTGHCLGMIQDIAAPAQVLRQLKTLTSTGSPPNKL